MAYYTALITAWNSVTQPPTGVSGTGLSSGMTTSQKTDAVNGWTVTSTIPSTIYISGDKVLNCIVWSEFNALTATQQANILNLCSNPGLLKGGSGNVSSLLPGMLLATLGSSSVTIANLTALASALPWWQANGYSSPFTQPDITAAGLS